MRGRSAGNVTCPACRAVNGFGSSQCFLCDGSLVGLRPDVGVRVGVGAAGHFSRPVGSIALIVAPVVLLVVLAAAAPGLAALLVIPALFGWFRVFAMTSDDEKRGPSFGDRARAFGGSFLGMTVAIAMLLAVFGVSYALVSSLLRSPRGESGGTLPLSAGVLAVSGVLHFLVFCLKHRPTAEGEVSNMGRRGG